MEVFLTKALTLLVLPPGVNLVVGVFGAALTKRFLRAGLAMVWLSLASLYALSLPACARALAAGLETYPPLSISGLAPHRPEAIVVLGGGIYPRAPEYGADTVSAENLSRLRFAAHLHRATNLPILVTGGRPQGTQKSAAGLMAEALERDFAVPVAWVEGESRNTAENAAYSQLMLEEAGLDEVIVVTHAWHMERAIDAFARVGVPAVAAPVEFQSARLGPSGGLGLLPQIGALRVSAWALHEYIGQFWYAIRY